MSDPKIYFDINDAFTAYELVLKGFRMDVYVEIYGKKYNLAIYTVNNLWWSYIHETDKAKIICPCSNLLILRKMWKWEIIDEIKRLARTDFFEKLGPIEDGLARSDSNSDCYDLKIHYEIEDETYYDICRKRGFRDDVVVELDGVNYKLFVMSLKYLIQEYITDVEFRGYCRQHPNLMLVYEVTKEEVEDTIIKRAPYFFRHLGGEIVTTS